MAREKGSKRTRKRKRKFYGHSNDSKEDSIKDNESECELTDNRKRLRTKSRVDYVMMNEGEDCNLNSNQKLDDDLNNSDGDKSYKLTNEFEQVEGGNIIIDVNLLLKSIAPFMKCDQCSGSISLLRNKTKTIGLFSEYLWYCSSCRTTRSTFSNCECVNGIEEINMRLFTSLAVHGLRNGAAKSICSILNLQQPPTSFKKYQERSLPIIENLSFNSMKTACEEAALVEKRRDITASFDGWWSKRGHKSNFGVMTACNPYVKKIIYSTAMGKYCQICKGQPNIKCNCNINQTSSSGSMETVGAIKIVTNLLRWKIRVRN